MEFAFVLPPLLLLTLPIIDFSWYLLLLQDVQVAAQEGARAGSRIHLKDDPVSVALSHATASLHESLPCCASNATYSASITNDILQVDVHLAYEPLAGFVPMPTQLDTRYRMLLEDP